MDQVSICNYEKLAEHVSIKYRQIIDTMLKIGKPVSTSQLAKAMHTQPHKISGRITELLNMDKIYRVRKRINNNGFSEWMVWIKWKNQ